MKGRKITYNIINGVKKCTLCKADKPECDFYFDTNSNRLRAECKDCQRKKNRSRLVMHRDQRRVSDLKKRYNINIDDWNNLMTIQDNKCAICGEPPQNDNRNLSTDHCHETGKVRGLLCRRCNMGIGYFKDNIDLLQKSIEYLRNSGKLN
jgi:hypothetical protein